MIRHRLARCRADQLVHAVRGRHPDSRTPVESPGRSTIATVCDPPGAPFRMTWRQRGAGGLWLQYRLEIDQGANGVLAHLSARPASPRSGLWLRIVQVAVDLGTDRELTALVRAAESDTDPD